MVKNKFYIASLFFLQLLSSHAANAQKSLTHDEKYTILREVYENVFMAMGIVDNPPELILDNQRTTSVAYLKRNKDGSKTLGVEDKAFDICMTFGEKSKEALAFLVGHELGHFRYNHHWGKDFASSFALADIEDKVAEATTKLSELKYFETQADHSGGISCFLAGYDILGMGEPLLRKIYKDYNLPSETTKYPSLETRILLTKQNDSIVGKLITVYEAGNYAMMAEEYTESIKCFEYILNKGFKSREIYNNLGVCAILRAMNLLGSETVKYVYPVEIDVESRLKGAHKGYSEETKVLLKKAKDYSGIAIQLDKNYSTGYINLACVNSLEGAIEEGKYNASKALKILNADSKDPSYTANANIIMAILLDQEKKTAEAKSLLTEVMKISPNYLAEVNLEIIKGKKAQDFAWAKKLSKDKFRNEAVTQPGTESKPETIEGITDFLKNLEEKELDEIEMNNSSCYYLPYKNSKIYNLTTADEHELYFQATNKNYTGQTSKGIKLQSSQSQILQAYGLPDAIYTSKGENMLVYRDTHLIFKLRIGLLSSWAVYKRY
jgi:hypothetical protein